MVKILYNETLLIISSAQLLVQWRYIGSLLLVMGEKIYTMEMDKNYKSGRSSFLNESVIKYLSGQHWLRWIKICGHWFSRTPIAHLGLPSCQHELEQKGEWCPERNGDNIFPFFLHRGGDNTSNSIQHLIPAVGQVLY